MKLRKVQQFINILILTGGIFTIFVSGCTFQNIFPEYPTPTYVPTPRVCPPDTVLVTGNELEAMPTLFVIVFDPNVANGGLGLEYKNGGEPMHNTLEFINNVVPTFSGPSDQFSLFEFGYHDYNDARVAGFESRLTSSPLQLTPPLPYLTATPYDTPNPTALATINAMDRQRILNTYNTNVEAQKQEIAQGLFDQHCRDKKFNETVHATATIWEAAKDNEVTQIANKIQNDEATKEAKNNNSATPVPYAEVYLGLRHAATDFQYLCSKYKKCILIIISDLLDWRNPSKDTRIPDDVTYKLENVDIISILPNCGAKIQDPICQDIISRWDGKFYKLGAKSTKYFVGDSLDGASVDNNFVSYIIDLKDKK